MVTNGDLFMTYRAAMKARNLTEFMEPEPAQEIKTSADTQMHTTLTTMQTNVIEGINRGLDGKLAFVLYAGTDPLNPHDDIVRYILENGRFFCTKRT